jgi:DNA topoisomerase I
MARLHRSNPASPGLRRVGSGRGFFYRAADGSVVREPAVLARIRQLAIPPAWREVWICVSPAGHIQATGVDAAGRRQYLYHDRWRARMDRRKFERALDLADALPAARGRVTKALHGRGPTKSRALAAGFRLLDSGAFRVGSEQYAANDGSVGLATLRCEHVRVTGSTVEFDFPAKGNLQRTLTVCDPDVVRALRPLLGRAGEDLLAWRESGSWRDVRSEDVNTYVREVTGGDFTAKDFRTWRATVVAAQSLADSGPTVSERTTRRAVSLAMAAAAEQLGNTPAIARTSYVDPRVVDRYRSGEMVDVAAAPSETAVRELLRGTAAGR